LHLPFAVLPSFAKRYKTLSGAFVPARFWPSRKTDLFRYDYDFIFYVKNGTFDESRFKGEKCSFRAFFMKIALKTKENAKKQDVFSQKVTFRA